jgi:gas vesicle protein
MLMPELAKWYMYCVTPAKTAEEVGNIGIGGHGDIVRTILYKDIAAVVSSTTQDKFDNSEVDILAHQRVVQTVFDRQLGLPMPFATVKENDEDVQRFLQEHYDDFKDKLSKLSTISNDSESDSAQPDSKDLLEELLRESATGAVRIRQLNEEISQLRSMRYEKAIENATEAMAKRISSHLSNVQDSVTQAIARLQQQIDHLRTEVVYSNEARTEKGLPPVDLIDADAEIRALREGIERLNRRSIEEMLVQPARSGS